MGQELSWRAGGLDITVPCDGTITGEVQGGTGDGLAMEKVTFGKVTLER